MHPGQMSCNVKQPYWCAQAVVAVFILEDVNYVEHYGLTRARAPSGMCALIFGYKKSALSE